jgi:hypothetical protein
MSSTEHFDELEHRLSELVKEAVQQVKDEFKEKLKSTREQVEEIVGNELNSAREAVSSAEADAAEKAEAFAAAEHRAYEASEALAAAESRLAEMAGALEAAESRAMESGGSLEAVETRAAEALAALESAESRAAEAIEANSAAEARINELSESLEAAEGRIAELSDAVNVAENDAAEAAAAAAAAPKMDLLGQIMAALGEVDQGRTQAEVLQGLLSGAGDFSSRTAVFLTGPDGLKGWGHRGFGSGDIEFDQIVINYDEGSAQSRLAGGRGVIELSEEDCFTICNQIDGSRPQGGVLIPLVLANRLAAALYADQFDDNPIHMQALQLLAYLAAQALETLPLREGGSAVTLQLESDVASDVGLELWDFYPPAAAPEPEIPETLEEITEAEAVDLESVQEEVFEIEEPGLSPEVVDYQAAEDSGFAVEVADEPAVDTAAEVIDVEPAVDTHYVEDIAAFEETEAEIEEAPADEAVEEMVATDDYVADVVEEPVEEEQEVVEAAVEEPMAEEAPTEVAPPPAAADGAQVAPPEDLDGPGWAFQTRNLGTEDGEGAAHEEARRLARLLVTEIKLYNEEQVEEGRRNRNIYQSLREDIDRSRQIYEERVDEAVRAGTDYFHDELVRILAAGESEVLGV